MDLEWSWIRLGNDLDLNKAKLTTSLKIIMRS